MAPSPSRVVKMLPSSVKESRERLRDEVRVYLIFEVAHNLGNYAIASPRPRIPSTAVPKWACSELYTVRKLIVKTVPPLTVPQRYNCKVIQLLLLYGLAREQRIQMNHRPQRLLYGILEEG
jgi:hypothetical protein